MARRASLVVQYSEWGVGIVPSYRLTCPSAAFYRVSSQPTRPTVSFAFFPQRGPRDKLLLFIYYDCQITGVRSFDQAIMTGRVPAYYVPRLVLRYIALRCVHCCEESYSRDTSATVRPPPALDVTLRSRNCHTFIIAHPERQCLMEEG